MSTECFVKGACVTPTTRSDKTPQGTVLGFDFGEKRIGVAVGDTIVKLAHPLVTIPEEINERRFAAIAALCEQWQPVLLVVGLPSYPDGKEHAITTQCRRFARRLEGRFGLPVVLIDERYTSVVAEASLTEINVFGRRRKAVLDQIAAQTILQSYLDQPHYGIT
ncbi:MAG: Holliday junction resolvase RuvX [Sulfuricella sp.]|nr:Holliday junction resolvase RuvX [Sulfuricella sp.]